MFCYQCEQNAKNKCFEEIGVCGKDDRTAMMQDLLVYSLKGLAAYSTQLKKFGLPTETYELMAIEGLFTTVTNVNFDAEKVKEQIKKVSNAIEKARYEYLIQCELRNVKISEPVNAMNFVYIDDEDMLREIWQKAAIESDREKYGKILAGLRELVLYGVKGMCAYLEHAHVLGYHNSDINAFIMDVLNFFNSDTTPEECLAMAMETGKMNLLTMELLDKAHNETFGAPVPTQVRVTPKKGKAILVSGHDLLDLYELLKQTEGKGINIYTHGEMLPAHGYPELNKFAHLVGNYGGAWQDQQHEFHEFPGAILMTTNCIQKPRNSYNDRIFTSGLVEYEGVHHIDNRDFTDLINKALKCDGFTEDGDEQNILTGFGHNAVLSAAGKVINLIDTGKIKKFFLIGGCDGAKSGRNYYTDFAAQAPQDSVIMTLACGKFRFNKMEFGDIEGLPRLLDIGQCNDAYSAIKIASALADHYQVGVNELPLSMILSWYEQKAVAILLTLLYLGIKNIRLGPSLPAFLEPEVINILVEKFNIMPITTVDEDLAATLA